METCSLVHFKSIFAKQINSLPSIKNLAFAILKTYADDKFSVAKMLKYVCDRIENNVGKGENDGYQHFRLFLQ